MVPAPVEDLPLVVICGPTAVGKTAASLSLAQRIGAEIIAADSRTIYRFMDIGTAKPTPEDRRVVPHHLLDIADPDEVITLATYRRLAGEAIAQVRGRGRTPLLVGGTDDSPASNSRSGVSPPACDSRSSSARSGISTSRERCSFGAKRLFRRLIRHRDLATL